MNYEDELIIDEHRLDKEWLQQATKYNTIYKLWAKKKKEARDLKNKITIVKAEVLLDIRNSFKDKKPPNADAVNAMVEVDKRTRLAFKEYSSVEEEADILKGGVESFNQRKEALQDLVKLQISGYYADPKESTGTFKNKALDKRSQAMIQKFDNEQKTKRRKNND